MSGRGAVTRSAAASTSTIESGDGHSSFTFHGDTAAYAGFKFFIKTTAAADEQRYQDNPTRVLALLAKHSRSRALDWLRTADETGAFDACATVADYFGVMDPVFKDTHAVDIANKRISQAFQGSRNLTDHCTWFCAQATQSNFNEEAKLHHFKHSLRADLQLPYALLPTPPATLLEAVQQAHTLDMARLAAQPRDTRTARALPQRPLPNHNPATAGGARYSGVDPQTGRLTQAERDRRRANNLCYRCGAADHQQADCPRSNATKTTTPSGSLNK